MSGNSRDREKVCIESTVRLLRRTDFPSIAELTWIDGVEKGDGLPDAVADPFLIEHFSIDSLPNQRRNSAWFAEWARPLEADSQGRLGFRVTVAIPEDAIKHRRDCKMLEAAFREWIDGPAKQLSDGFHEQVNIARIAFSVRVWKGGHMDRNGVVFLRTADGARDLDERLKEIYREKMCKLRAHSHRAKRCLLIVESAGDHLMSAHSFLAAFKRISPDHGFDDTVVWFIQTSNGEQFFALDVETGRLFLADESTGEVVGKTWICAG